MADRNSFSEIIKLKNSQILVNVEEALQDVLVVTYALEDKFFQGVLLDSSKRLLPCGIVPPPPTSSQTNEKGEVDKLFSVSQRFTYFQDKSNNDSLLNGMVLPQLTSKAKLSSRLKPARMTVRLRPRQVLCSKCKSICNDNSENVDNTKNVKNEPQKIENVSKATITVTPNKPIRTLRNLRPSLIPKLNRLEENEINNAVNGKLLRKTSSVEFNIKANPLGVFDTNLASSNVKSPTTGEEVLLNTTEGTDKEDEEDGEEKMVLRKKRSVGSMEDLWDENVFVEASKKARTTPVIKISFGSQGEGTVLKIPSKVQNCSESEPEEKMKTASAKAAKKALKKAKKEARRKLGSSPGTSPAYEALHYRRHRHKVKHKKKHKEDRSEDSVVYSDMKERCLKQKLSISLRRLNTNAYTRSESGSSESSSSGSSSEEAIPDFPALEARGLAGINPSRSSADGTCSYSAGDIVWGKIQGFPWWPGKVTKVVEVCAGGEGEPQAHVTWYGSSTSSLISCHQLSPFLETFKSRFNKKKKSGPYKEAIRQATSEASDISQKIMHSPLRSIMSSPTPVHVQ